MLVIPYPLSLLSRLPSSFLLYGSFCYSHGISYYNYANFAIFFYFTNLPTLFNFYIILWAMLTPTQITKMSSRKKVILNILEGRGYFMQVQIFIKYKDSDPKWFRFTKEILLCDFWQFSGAPRIRDHASHRSFQYTNILTTLTIY